MKILIAEDEVELAKGLKYLLEKSNYSVDLVHNGEDALLLFQCTEYDAVILDIMMPKVDGLEVLRSIRSQKSAVPVMLLTAKSAVDDRVTGLEMGADDYLPKPFATREFIARVKALTRRAGGYADSVLSMGNVTLDVNKYEVSCRNHQIRLNNKEYQLLNLFMRNPHMVFSTGRILSKIWNQDTEVGADVVWTHIGYVRRKLENVGADIEIKTIRGAGYSLEEKPC